MRNAFQLFFLIAFSASWLQPCKAQQLLLGQSRESKTILAEVDLLLDTLQPIADPVEEGRLWKELDLSLRNQELVVVYRLKEPERLSFGYDYQYRISLKLFLGEQTVILNEEDFIGAYPQPLKKRMGAKHELIITNLVNKIIPFQDTLRAEFEATLSVYSPADFPIVCGNPPTNSIKSQWPYYLAMAMGTATIVAGQSLENQSDDVYDTQYLGSSSFNNAEPFYQDANDKFRTAQGLKNAGLAVLFSATAVVIYKQITHRRRMKIYNDYCNDDIFDKITVAPFYELLPFQSFGAGLKFSISL